MKSLTIVLTLLFSTLTFANLYQCKNPGAEPEKAASTENLSFTLHQKSSNWFGELNSRQILKNKKIPFLALYVIDSEEPYMKYATAYEIAKLVKACTDSSYINFAAILNSAYVKENKFFICRDKTPKWILIEKYPKLNKRLLEKKQMLLNGDNTLFNSIFNYRVIFNRTVNAAFSRFPLAHPDFLHDILETIFTEPELFPSGKYIPVLHLKSHGSRETVLSGLYSCQEQAKVKSQVETLNDLLSTSDLAELNTFDPFKVNHIKLDSYEKIVTKVGLGLLSNRNQTANNSDNDLGNINLGDINLGNINLGNINLNSSFQVSGSSGLGVAFSSLGANDGLGTEIAFGLDHLTLNTVLDDLFNVKNKRILAFLMLESCDTNRESTFEFKYAKNLFGYYSASHSLWYRNLDWWKILHDSQGKLLDVLKNLEADSKKIMNIEIVE